MSRTSLKLLRPVQRLHGDSVGNMLCARARLVDGAQSKEKRNLTQMRLSNQVFSGFLPTAALNLLLLSAALGRFLTFCRALRTPHQHLGWRTESGNLAVVNKVLFTWVSKPTHSWTPPPSVSEYVHKLCVNPLSGIDLPWLDVQGNQSGVRTRPLTLMGEVDR